MLVEARDYRRDPRKPSEDVEWRVDHFRDEGDYRKALPAIRRMPHRQVARAASSRDSKSTVFARRSPRLHRGSSKSDDRTCLGAPRSRMGTEIPESGSLTRSRYWRERDHRTRAHARSCRAARSDPVRVWKDAAAGEIAARASLSVVSGVPC